MARQKKFYLKDAKDNFQAGLNMLSGEEMPEIQALRAAARQAQEAAATLYQLVGVIESEMPTGVSTPSKGLESEKTRLTKQKGYPS